MFFLPFPKCDRLGLKTRRFNLDFVVIIQSIKLRTFNDHNTKQTYILTNKIYTIYVI